MTKKALYAGTFDPFTNGHLDIVLRAKKLFDELTILVAIPPKKKPYLDAKTRVDLLEELFNGDKSITIDTWDGLIVDYARQKKVSYLVRGLRPIGDFDSEFQMATMNSRLNKDLETVFLATGEDFYYVSSSLVKEIHEHGGDISQFVPENVLKALNTKKD